MWRSRYSVASPWMVPGGRRPTYVETDGPLMFIEVELPGVRGEDVDVE